MIMVLDPEASGARLAAAALACPGCGQPLRPWGYARARSVPGLHGTVRVRPQRARCRGCRTTHVLLPAQLLPRRPVSVEVIGAALLAAAQGTGHRRIATRLRVPTGTVRNWLRRARDNAEWLRQNATVLAHQLDPELPPLQPYSTRLAEAVDALAVAAAAATRRLAWRYPPWQFIAVATGGHLLTRRPTPS